MDIMTILIGLLAGIIVGGGIVWVALNSIFTRKKTLILENAEQEAEALKKDKILQAKEKFYQLKEEHEKVINERNRKLQSSEDKVKTREAGLSKKFEEGKKERQRLESARGDLERQVEAIETRRKELEKDHRKVVERLEKVSNLSADDAKKELMTTLRDEARTEAMGHIKTILDEAKITANAEAKKVVIQSIQRVATEHVIENSVSVFNIESDEIKGRIIGREGRNIRAIEASTGVEIIVDDTPEAIILSCFDPVRREVARLALHQLVTDGRIHPARIEEVVNKVNKQLDDEIIETGKRTCIDLGIHGLHPNLLRMVGRMKYRSSYGQNLLQHSREVANLSAIMAAELGLNTKLAKRAGLLHDIGKVPEDEPELPHAILGMKLAEKFGEKPEVVNAIGAHHDEIEMNNLISPIVQVCDAISGARPGARREVVESYIKRLKDLENLALSYPETDMTYPGQVKITVIREKRAVNYAK